MREQTTISSVRCPAPCSFPYQRGRQICIELRVLIASGCVCGKLQQFVKHGRLGRHFTETGVNCTYLVAITKGSQMNTRIFCILLAAAAISGGCAVVPATGPYYDYGEPVVVAPPPPRVEYVGRPPIVGQVWIGGFWSWTGHRHQWVPGHWAAPRHGYYWAPHRWERDGRHWRQEGGRWEKHPQRRSERRFRDDGRRDWR